MSSNWKLKWDRRAIKEVSRLPRSDQKKIILAVEGLLEDTQKGKALRGRWKGLWRLRVGNYRVIYAVQKSELLILVVRVGHRREVYR